MLLSLPKVEFDLSLYLRLTNEHSVQKSVMSINTNTKEVEQVISMYLKMGLMQMSVCIGRLTRGTPLFLMRWYVCSPYVLELTRGTPLFLMRCYATDSNLC